VGLLLICINDIVTDIHSEIRLFANDTSLYLVVDKPRSAAAIINSDLARIGAWAEKWLVTFNPEKNVSLIISNKFRKPDHPSVYMNDIPINETS